MSELDPVHRLDVPLLLHAAKLLDGDPQVDDLGPLYAAVVRTGAQALNHDVYGGPEPLSQKAP